ncbi:hypothetical protein VNO78_13128 [Psophocarpus tetragonolobus]|uniref:Uncharacterized protein n=1 Tax=Psophocarpus tetragonolobus TaxID=3891 RepID=A0AAN9XQA3_PSOTE
MHASCFHNSFLKLQFIVGFLDSTKSHKGCCVVTFLCYLRSCKLKMESSLGDMLIKVAVFIVVQGLVYLILSNSSNIFSKNIKRSHSFKPARSLSIRRMLAFVSDFPPEGEPSPSPKGPNSSSLLSD